MTGSEHHRRVNNLFKSIWLCTFEGPKLATRGGEWEPIKISFEIDPSAYISKITTNPQVLDEVWSSYRRAKPTQISPRNEREKIRKRSRKTANLTVRDWSDRSLWAVRPVGLDLKFQTGQTGCSDRSDRFLRPVRPLLPRTEFQPANSR